MSLRKVLPPIITDFIRSKRKIKKYKNYDEALSYCTTNAYQNEELCSVVADKTLTYIKSLKRPFTLNPTTVYLAFSINYFANIANRKSITVLDFGGACGAHYYEVRNLIAQTILLKWIVIETEQMILSAANRGLIRDELSFASCIEGVSEPIDFIHSSSALQYVPNPYDFLKQMVDMKAKMILFNRMMFNKRDYDIVTVQRSFLSSNGPGTLPPGYKDKPIMYPHTMMSINKVNLVMKAGGYERISEFDESSGSFSLGNEEVLGKGLLFVRK